MGFWGRLKTNIKPRNFHKQAFWLLLALVFSWILLLLRFGFFSDDFVLLEQVREQGWHFFMPFPAGSKSYWRPLVMLSLYLTPSNQPLLHHLINGLILGGSTFLVYYCGKELGLKVEARFFAAGLYLVHRCNLTNAIWISGRTDLFATFFCLLCLYSFSRYLARGKLGWALVSVGAMVLALLSKEQAIILAPLCFAVWILRWRSHKPRQEKEHGWFVLASQGLITLVYSGFIFSRFYSSSPGVVQPNALGANLIKNVLFLAAPFRPNRQVFWTIGVACGTLLLLAFFIIWCNRKTPKNAIITGAFTGFLVVFAMLPSLLFLKDASPRLLSLPLALGLLGVGWLMERTTRRFRPCFFAILVVFGIGSLADYRRWVANDSLAKQVSRDFADQMKDQLPSKPFVLLGAPSTRWSVPVFGNDMNHAFYFATYGRFGRFPNGSAVGQIAWPGGLIETIQRDDIEQGTFFRELTSQAFYAYGPNTKEGERFKYGAGETTVLKTAQAGEVTAFRFQFAAHFLNQSPIVFDFNGESLVRIH